MTRLRVGVVGAGMIAQVEYWPILDEMLINRQPRHAVAIQRSRSFRTCILKPDVDGLGVAGHGNDVRAAEVFVQAGGDAERVLEEVTCSQFAEDMRAVPIIPFVE